MPNVIICALSPFHASSKESPYQYGEGRQYMGSQTNDAPTKCLLDLTAAENENVAAIVYLCSKESRKPDPISAEEHFRKQVKEFCNTNAIEAPELKIINYDFENPDKCLPEVIKALENTQTYGTPVRIHVDLTGAGRDATMLLALVSQTLAQQPSFELGTVVYANYQPKNQQLGKSNKIFNENKTFDLVELMQAVRAFTAYGRADGLYDYFQGPDWSDETSALRESMRLFSDDLSLCQVGSIGSEVAEIHRNLDALIAAVDNYAGHPYTISEAIEHGEAHPETSSKEQLTRLKMRLSAFGDQLAYATDEVLLASLAPSIKADFISKGRTDGETIFGAIRWCADHHMLQQALCIFTEHMGRCLLELGYVHPTEQFYDLLEDDRIDMVRDLSKAFDVKKAGRGNASFLSKGSGTYSVSHRFHGKQYDYEYKYKDCFSIEDSMSETLATIIPRISYVRGKRNLVAHSDIRTDNNRAYTKACELLERDPNESLGPVALDDAIEDVLKRIEQDDAQWENLQRVTQSNGILVGFNAKEGYGFIAPDEKNAPDAFVSKKQALKCGMASWKLGSIVSFERDENNRAVKIRKFKEPKDNKKGGPDKPSQKPTPAFNETQKALLEYAKFRKAQGEGPRFNTNEGYNTWASRNSKITLTKKALGLGSKAIINQELARNFPDTFTARSNGNIEITPEVWNTI